MIYICKGNNAYLINENRTRIFEKKSLNWIHVISDSFILLNVQ